MNGQMGEKLSKNERTSTDDNWTLIETASSVYIRTIDNELGEIVVCIISIQAKLQNIQAH